MITVHLADCMDIMKTYSNGWFDLACVDPPYGLPNDAVHGRGKLRSRALNSMNMEWDVAPKDEYFNELLRISKNQIIWGGNYFQLPPTRGFIIWDKEQPFDNFSACEFALTSFNMPSKIYQEATTRTGEIKIHPTQKSVKLYTWIFKRYLPQGGKVIDTHGGSMSSVISAAKAGNIEMVCSEIDEDYFNDAEKRIKTYFDQGNLFQSKPDITFIR